VPAPDEVRLKPAVGWLLAGIPRMQAGIRDSLAKPVTLALTGSYAPPDDVRLAGDRSAP